MRVRMGLHTGAPIPHDGAYVGIDVHRAARIAASAHGGQIVLSAATAALVSESLVDGLSLRDLGDHRFKDLERSERVYQLEVDGLDQAFPPLRSLGMSSTLPLLDAALLGRDAEPGATVDVDSHGADSPAHPDWPGRHRKDEPRRRARAVTGRRLSRGRVLRAARVRLRRPVDVGIDRRRRSTFRKGERRTTSRRLSIGAESSLVIDNLEQLDGAAKVAHGIIDQAPDIVVIATSRRPAPPHRRAGVSGSSACVARRRGGRRRREGRRRCSSSSARRAACGLASIWTRATLPTSPRSVDGSTAFRWRSSSRRRAPSCSKPHSLLARLGSALDLSTPERDRPTRHQTLRDTIEWSYQLLAPEQQRLFGRLGVFVGGADLDAVAAVGMDDGAIYDPLDVVAGVVDASLAQMVESDDVEPRVVMLETIRAFAAELLESSADRDEISERHAAYYADVVETQCARVHAQDHLTAQAVLETEFANISAALEWSLADGSDDTRERTRRGVRIVARIGTVWGSGGRVDEAMHWLRRAVERGAALADADVAVCTSTLANFRMFRGEDGRQQAQDALDLFRALGNPANGLPFVLRTMATVELGDGRLDQARALYEEAVAVARAADDLESLHRALSGLAVFVGNTGNLELCRQMEQEALDLTIELGDPRAELGCRQNLACTLRLMGQIRDAESMMTATVVSALAIYATTDLIYIGDDYGAILAQIGRDHDAVRLLGASDAEYERLKMPRGQVQTDEIMPAYDQARARLAEAEWVALYAEGRATPLEEALAAAVHEASSISNRSASGSA